MVACAGVLVARAALDYEAAPAHELVLRATDGVTGAFADAAVTLRVLDVNDCAPEFPQDVYRAAVSEAAAIGQLVLGVRASDNDTGASRPAPRPTRTGTNRLVTGCIFCTGENGEVTYSLSEMDSAASGAFTIEPGTGAVRVAAPLDREARAHYHLLLGAADAGRPPLLTTAHLFVTGEHTPENRKRSLSAKKAHKTYILLNHRIANFASWLLRKRLQCVAVLKETTTRSPNCCNNIAK